MISLISRSLGICRSPSPLLSGYRTFRLPPRLFPYLEDYIKDYKNKDSDAGEIFQSLKVKVNEHKELEALSKCSSSDSELRVLAVADIKKVDEEIEDLFQNLVDELVPGESYDLENAMLEVVPGAGGQEASLFAEEIFNFYLGFCQSKGCQVEIVEYTKNSGASKNSKATTSNGIVKAVARILSDEPVFSLLKFESGVHRVQRVPLTGTKADRLQTSTCSVAVLPEPRAVTLNLSASDLKWEFMRASGAGGQGVNTTDSAVRLTHLPSGQTVESQEERSQVQNKKRALVKLQRLLYQQAWTAQQGSLAASRKLQVGSMNRNEKIRTYNYNRHMVTEHRLGQSTTFPSIQLWLAGSLGYQVLDNYRHNLHLLDREDRLDILINSARL